MSDEAGLEWDERKRAETLQARGLDFADVALLNWDRSMTVEDLRQDYGERRYVTLGPIKDRLCVIAWCWRGEAMRIISLRKANAREERKYEETIDRG